MNKLTDIKSLFQIALISMVTTLFCGCTDELIPDADPSDYTSEMATLTINVPVIGADSGFDIVNTRAGLENDEAVYSNIYLLAVNTSTGKVTAFDLSGILGEKNSDGYREAQIQIMPATYMFYVLANFNRYLDGTTLDQYVTSEYDIKNLATNFTTDIPITPGNLPMACLGTTPYEITASKNTYKLETMDILCAKVRYTILFDARPECISKDFGSAHIQFLMDDVNYPTVQNVNTGTGEWQDVTSQYITNADFQNSLNGWTYRNCTSEYVTATNETVIESYNTSYFYIYKTARLKDIGKYRLDVQGFYRYGAPNPATGDISSMDEFLNGSEKLLPYLYFGDQKKPLRSLYSENNYTIDPYTYPDHWSTASAAFNSDNIYYNYVENEITSTNFYIEFGIQKDSGKALDWTAFDNFKLYYKPFENDAIGSQPINLGRYTFEEEQKNIDYKTSSYLPILKAWDEKTGTIDQWYALDHKAWQGVVYLPQNTSEKKTKLVFPYSFQGVDGKKADEKVVELCANTKQKLEAGKMYDVLMLVKTPSEFVINIDSPEPDISGYYLIMTKNSATEERNFASFSNEELYPFYPTTIDNQWETEPFDFTGNGDDTYYLMVSDQTTFYGKNTNSSEAIQKDISYQLASDNAFSTSKAFRWEIDYHKVKAVLIKDGNNLTLTLKSQ